MTLVQDKPIVATNDATFKQWSLAWAKGDFDHAPYAEDAETTNPTGHYKGKTQIVDSFKVWKTAFPQLTVEVTNQLAEGERLASELILRGTHSGLLASAMGPIPATGKPVELRVAVFSTFREGLIQRSRAYFDLAGLMRQLGVSQPKI
jgi:steroid delta-isomerase-like uncharacterized protein